MRRLSVLACIVIGGCGLAWLGGCAKAPSERSEPPPAGPARAERPPAPPPGKQPPTSVEEAARKAQVEERADGEWVVTGEGRRESAEGEMGIMGAPGSAAGGMMGGAGGGGGTEKMAMESAAPAAEGGVPPSAPPPPTATTPAPGRMAGGMAMSAQPAPKIAPETTPLAAGEVDDNQLFEKYLQYERKYQAGGGVKRFDPQERYLIHVVDPEGRGVPDALVTLADPEQPDTPLFRGHTTAAGQVVFFPAAYGVTSVRKLTLTAYKSVEKATQTVSRQDAGGTWTIRLKEPWTGRTGIHLDVLFVVDTTGSMSEEIDRVRDTIQEVSRLIRSLEAKPLLRLGIVLYRDRGDEYLTKRRPFTEDVDDFEAALQDVQAGGGGDGPEDVNSALQQAVEAMNWYDGEALRLVFLIADAPPHLDYGQEYDYFLGTQRAVEKGIKIFAVSTSGMDDVGEYAFRQMALLTLGRFVFITKGGSDGLTPHHVERSDFSVERLDVLIVRLVSEELAALGKVSG